MTGDDLGLGGCLQVERLPGDCLVVGRLPGGCLIAWRLGGCLDVTGVRRLGGCLVVGRWHFSFLKSSQAFYAFKGSLGAY